jgi:hypothetical protein
MGFFRVGHPVGVGIALQPFHDGRADLVARLGIRGRDYWCDRC